MKRYDPKLREAMVEIKKILKDYDIAAFIALASPTHGEFEMTIDQPTWSNVRFINDGKGVHVKIHMASDKKRTEATISALMAIHDLSAMGFGQAKQIVDIVKKHVEIDHTPFAGKGINHDDIEKYEQRADVLPIKRPLDEN